MKTKVTALNFPGSAYQRKVFGGVEVRVLKGRYEHELHLKIQSVPRSKHTPSLLQKPIS